MYYSGTIYIEVNILIDQDDSPLNCTIPFDCERRTDNESDPTRNRYFNEVTINKWFCAPEWVNSSILDHAEKKANERWDNEFETFY